MSVMSPNARSRSAEEIGVQLSGGAARQADQQDAAGGDALQNSMARAVSPDVRPLWRTSSMVTCPAGRWM